ncbi:MAG TPA: xylose isomerase [Mesotoga infera]|jgi:xylose isomerase|uniref:Xylose isomerase n=1 Tax=Mesotoga infera TaxID=1236046 RepID=A0A7Z7LCS3_9BACT|nr:xylose isomerase [Mesotoga infera]MBP8660458.1 xylose isomerase [Mesotoga sp.]NLI06337.1 xylose isomerase [Thermotogaceae bacterium]SSC11561.1 D-xylose isomerase [Mesotoga infera]HNR79132.1 xylose isomerase [Mesotoga infera]HNS67970.1 xylose isomerase [Mesotoga infera]
MIFKDIDKIRYMGPDNRDPLAFSFYDPEEEVFGVKMSDYLRFSIAFWHTFKGDGKDMFGEPNVRRGWSSIKDEMTLAKIKIDGLFELCEKLDIKYFCFHDRDIAPEGETLRETNRKLDEVVGHIKDHLKDGKVRVLWGTANLFSNPRFVHGAATSCSAEVFAYAAAQVKKAIEITKELGGENYVFWGGREGYETLLNTDMSLEIDNLGRFMKMAVDYAKEIGFTGQFLIEPKPMEPTKHQYDFDVANSLAFLRKYGLENNFKFNIEANHATLAGHTFQHELRYARINGMLGSVDANQGDTLLGWDTDQFPTDLYTTTLAMYEIALNGGLKPGGLNFDAKVRRGSMEEKNLFAGHIAGMDTFALGLKAAILLLEEGSIEKLLQERYSSFSSGIGKEIVDGTVSFKSLESYIIDRKNIFPEPSNQEYLERLVNWAIANAAR